MTLPAEQTLDLQSANRPPESPRPSASLARLLARVPEPVRDGFTADQLAALDRALADDLGRRHPIDIRFTVFGRVFMVILGGRERRNRQRRIAERSRHPLRTVANILFLIWVSVMGLTLGSALQWLTFGG